MDEVQMAYEKYCNLLYQYLLTNCPIDTGNMITHIRMNQDGDVCKIIIDTIPYSKAPVALKKRIRKYGKNVKEVEYAAFTEYKKVKNPNEGWVRMQSILPAAYEIAGANVINYLEL